MSLPGFEILTADLTDKERELIPGFVRGFANKIGAERAITNKQIIEKYGEMGIVLSGARVRKIISYMRENFIVPRLVASSKGYFITNDPEEMRRFIESLKGRNYKIGKIIEAAEKDLEQLLKKTG